MKYLFFKVNIFLFFSLFKLLSQDTFVVNKIDSGDIQIDGDLSDSVWQKAKIIPIENGNVEIDEVLNTNSFDFARAQQSPGWLKEMRGEHVPETEEYGISSFSYEARRPFHPEKFHNFLHGTEKYGKLIRSKGYFWLATRPEFAGQWSQAGGIARYGFAGMFWKAVPEKDWPQEEEYLESIKKQWVEPFGDMRQELVFIGQRLQKEKMIAALDACLLSEEDVLKGREYWSTFNDPFPAWK